MIKKTIFFVALVKIITAQRLPYNYPQVYKESLMDRFTPNQYLQSPAMSPAENDVICKNLATAIQNAIFDRFSQSCFRTPVFGPISPPLVNEIKNSMCTCPLCSTINVSPNGYTKSYVPPSAVSNVIKSSVPNVVSNSYSRGKPSVGVNRNYDILAMLKGVCDCGCRGPV